MSVNFMNLNKGCPKDSCPLHKIDKLVDFMAGQVMLSFMDAFFGSHHIPLYPHDQENATFIIGKGLYCYKLMSFGLKNVGMMYQQSR